MREWWEKHAPRASKDLCVAPKKVAEVRDWLRSRVPSLRAEHGNHGGGVVVGSGRVLLLTGPTGCGKSTAVELLCAELGLRLLRWSAPTPTLWHEHAYQGDLAAGYVSKQREFEEFLSRSTIMSQIPLGPSGSGGGGGGGLAFGKSVRAGGTVVLIDDLPATNGFQKHQELVDSLRRFCGSSRHPVVLCLSTIHKQDARDNQGYYQDRVVRSLELSTECKVCTFPAVTAPRIAKVLERASESENHYVDRQALSSIAESSNGDVRNALCTLQFRLVGETREEGVGAVRAKRKRKRKGEVEKRAGVGGGMAPPPPSGGAGPCSRDRELNRLHVLGKILYNKRTEEGLPENDAEEIVRMSHLDAPQLLSWVHENFPDFLGEDAIEECDRISAYLSDAAALMEDGETLPPSLFASLPVADFPLSLSFAVTEGSGFGATPSSLVGVMGYQYGRVTKPSRSLGFHQMRRPQEFDVDKARTMNLIELQYTSARRSRESRTQEPRGTLIAEVLPYSRALACAGARVGDQTRALNIMPRGWHTQESCRGMSKMGFVRVGVGAGDGERLPMAAGGGDQQEEEDEIEEV